MNKSSDQNLPDAKPSSKVARQSVVWLLLLLALLVIITVARNASQTSHASLVPWQAAETMDQLTGQPAGTDEIAKPKLVRFTADWCPPCQEMDRDVFSRQDIADAITSRFTPISVDLTQPSESQTLLATRYNIAYIPTLLVLDRDAKELARVSGGLDAKSLESWLAHAGNP